MALRNDDDNDKLEKCRSKAGLKMETRCSTNDFGARAGNASNERKKSIHL